MTKTDLMLCRVFRSERKEGTYLYTRLQTKSGPLDDLPEELLNTLGELTEVMTIKLHKQRKLANANVEKVMSELDDKGFYLQLPPLKKVMLAKAEGLLSED